MINKFWRVFYVSQCSTVVFASHACSNAVTFQSYSVRPVESHSRARGNILAEPPNIFTGPLWGDNF